MVCSYVRKKIKDVTGKCSCPRTGKNIKYKQA
jgi:hypothetical protein